MTAQQSPHAPVRLLIAESSENDAHAFDSLLRDAGIATRTEVVDLSMALESVTQADLMLANSELPELHQIMGNLKKTAPNVPIILINHDAASLTTTAGLQMGAADVVPKSEPDLLVLVVKRELEKVSQTQRLDETRRALEEAEQRCQLLLSSSQAAIAYVHEGMHIYANEGYLELFGFEDSDDLLGLPLIDLLDEASTNALKGAMKKFRNDGEECQLDFTGQDTQGHGVAGNMTLAAAEYEGEACMQVTIRTAAPLAAEAEQVPTLLAPAPPAGNGAAVELELVVDTEPARAEPSRAEPSRAEPDRAPSANGIEAATPAPPEPAPKPQPAAGPLSISDFLNAINDLDHGQETAVFTAEIDHFAKLQNEHGIAGAADIARHAESQLGSSLESTPFTQLSNYQFAFAAVGAEKETIMVGVEQLAEKLGSLMLEIGAKTVRASVSFGGAMLDRSEPGSAEVALNTAFSTLRAALEEGATQCVVMPVVTADGTVEHSDEASQILRLINEAIENHKFVLLFQPIISLRGDSDEHYEVFLRMLNREGEQMAPGQFLRTAVDNGVAGKIDRWVVLQSIKMLSNHRAKGHNTRLTINLTSNSVTDPEFLDWLSVAIKAARLPSDAVIFQITEQDAGNYVRQTREFMEGLKQMHCRASLSRFGLSDDPFELLAHIPADFVKLDGAKIESISKQPELRDSVTKMIGSLQGAGKLTIVPMVESATVLSALWQAGANYIQGHYLQEPSTEMDYDFSTDD